MSISLSCSLCAALSLFGLGARVVFAQREITPLPYTGVNLSGGEFGDAKPGVTSIFGKNYTYPTPNCTDGE